MKFDKPAGENPIDQLKVVGRPHDRIDGPLKTTGTARYAYEWHEEAPNAAYGYIVGSAIAKGRLTALDTDAAQKAPLHYSHSAHHHRYRSDCRRRRYFY
jgi:xanthine dehydrogenase YagR molybdenum-binding subunit